jgi:NAD(P)-dependent dehydrogenase (short-subunit alcohol dehydrogenase family)
MKTVSDLQDMSGRVAVITGGAGHIGSAVCNALAEHGASIVIVDSNEPLCRETCRQLHEDYGTETLPLMLDLTDEKSLREIPGQVTDRFPSLDVLIHCAALVGTSNLKGWGVPFIEQNADTWRLALEVNLTAPFILTQSCSGELARSGHGSVINIGSIYGINGPDMQLYEGTSMGNPAAYAASKGGLMQLTRYLATVLAPRIRVNAITLGGVYRNQPEPFLSRYVNKTPLHRMATEEDIKGAAVFLASDLSSYVTGHNLVIDGGFTVW